jgi:hypothetical protein
MSTMTLCPNSNQLLFGHTVLKRKLVNEAGQTLSSSAHMKYVQATNYYSDVKKDLMRKLTFH